MFKFAPISSVLSRAAILSLVLTVSVDAAPGSKGRILNGRLHHLGDDTVTIVPGTSSQPEGERLDVKFSASKNKSEMTLGVTYWDVNNPATVKLNGTELESLPNAQNRAKVYLRVPVGTLRQGENELSILPKAQDDCVIGEISLHDQTFRDLMNLEPVTISVKDSDSGEPLPARLTITDPAGKPADVFLPLREGTAVRKGLVYINGKDTTFEVRKGNYVIYATHGMEWSRDKKSFSVKSAKTAPVRLQLRREVDTTGFVACDTHMHTLTFSGHGDVTVQERMVTLAGEGVELAVATDHNHHTDFRPYQTELGLNAYFTPVIGNEITTRFGHINGFPMPLNGQIPDYKETNWVKLVDDIRFRGAKVVILNHPRWKSSDVFAGLNLNTVTGENSTYKKLPFDAIELANSSATQTSTLDRFADWFALLNHGENLKAVGSSDSHYLSMPVGQGRTYLRSSTDDPAKISIDEACKNFLAGHSSISLGMFADILVEDKFHAGDLVPVQGSRVHGKFRVQAPSWVTPRRALLYLNGMLVAVEPLHREGNAPLDKEIDFTFPAPEQDAYLVCVAVGEPVTEPFWPARENILAANNPVFLDADNDGVYRSPRESAKIILSKTADDLDARWDALRKTENDGVATQMLDLIYNDAGSVAKAELRKRLQKSAAGRPVFGKFLEFAEAQNSKL